MAEMRFNNLAEAIEHHFPGKMEIDNKAYGLLGNSREALIKGFPVRGSVLFKSNIFLSCNPAENSKVPVRASRQLKLVDPRAVETLASAVKDAEKKFKVAVSPSISMRLDKDDFLRSIELSLEAINVHTRGPTSFPVEEKLAADVLCYINNRIRPPPSSKR